MLSAKTWCVDNPDAWQSGISMGWASPVPLQCLKSAEENPEPRTGLLDPLGICWYLGGCVQDSPSPELLSQNQPQWHQLRKGLFTPAR